MVELANVRWEFHHPDIPEHLGMVANMDKFDNQFFKIHRNLARGMEPQHKKLLEHAYGAIYDAG